MMTHHSTRVEAANLLNCSTRTIEDHRARIMGKLDVDNIVDLVKRVVKMGGASRRTEDDGSP